MKRLLSLLCCMLLLPLYIAGQGFYNHIWLLGSYNFLQDPKGKIEFSDTGYVHTGEFRKMSFKGTEATICNAQGDLMMSTNGIWIANSNNDTMMNGVGLNPNGITGSWPYGLPMTANAMFLPYPGDTTKYVLFHHTTTFDGYSYTANDLYNSVVDISTNGGLGTVITKNNVVVSDTFNWGIGACKHANGRDWWVVMSKHNTDSILTCLLTSTGILQTSWQELNTPRSWYNLSQLSFSSKGDEFYMTYYDSATVNYYLAISTFDRCAGVFQPASIVQLTNNEIVWGLCSSPSGKYVYACSSSKVFQINTTSFTVDTVAYYDGFISPPNSTCCATTFWNMYLAANGKIYITSGSGVQHLHEMNYPDSAGLACDVQQHAINLGYAQLRAVPNHPNYNLGPVVGSVCDTLGVGIPELAHDFHFSIAPNPVSDGWIKLTYLLPQNQSGVLEVYSLTGQKVYSQTLPPWSTLQFVHLPNLEAGIYTAVIISGKERSAKKLVVMK